MSYHRENRSGGGGGKKYGKKDFGKRSFGGRGRDSDRDSDKPSLHDAVCSECGEKCQVPFKPTGNRPVLCRDCFKNSGGGGGDRDNQDFGRKRFGDRKFGEKSSKFSMHQATCDECGNQCEVPFRPSGEKPVYCQDCFGKTSGRYNTKESNNSLTSEQFEILNSKLDKILEALESD